MMNRAEHLHIYNHRVIVVGQVYGQSGTRADAATDSQPADDVCYKPRGRLPLLTSRLFLVTASLPVGQHHIIPLDIRYTLYMCHT